MQQFTLLKDRLLLDMHDDETGLWWAIGIAEELFAPKSEKEVQPILLKVIHELLNEGLIMAGIPKLVDDERKLIFEDWGMEPKATIEKIETEWQNLKRNVSLGDIVWFTTTEKGDDYIEDNNIHEKYSAICLRNPDCKRRNVFKESQLILPPEQVFKNSNFSFLLTTGGSIAQNEDQYSQLMQLISTLGEKKFMIFENGEVKLPHKETPFVRSLSVNSKFEDYETAEKEFEATSGFTISSFYIFGEKRKWGIYLCECPTILIIGCLPDLADKFRSVYNIKGNGYEDLKSFIAKEFNNRKDLIEKFEKNYKLNS